MPEKGGVEVLTSFFVEGQYQEGAPRIVRGGGVPGTPPERRPQAEAGCGAQDMSENSAHTEA